MRQAFLLIQPLQTIHEGDHLRLKLNDGNTIKAVFQTMNAESVTVTMSTSSTELFQQRTFLFSDIASIERWDSRPGNTCALVGVSALVVAVIVFASTFQFHPFAGSSFHL